MFFQQIYDIWLTQLGHVKICSLNPYVQSVWDLKKTKNKNKTVPPGRRMWFPCKKAGRGSVTPVGVTKSPLRFFPQLHFLVVPAGKNLSSQTIIRQRRVQRESGPARSDRGKQKEVPPVVVDTIPGTFFSSCSGPEEAEGVGETARLGSLRSKQVVLKRSRGPVSAICLGLSVVCHVRGVTPSRIWSR